MMQSMGCKESDIRVRARPLQACLTLCHPVDCSPPGSSIRGDAHTQSVVLCLAVTLCLCLCPHATHASPHTGAHALQQEKPIQRNWRLALAL